MLSQAFASDMAIGFFAALGCILYTREVYKKRSAYALHV